MDRSRLIIIPAYNEASTIGHIVTVAAQFGTVLVVDDRSRDATADIARTAGAIVETNSVNLGYERNLNKGFAYAIERGFECVLTIDADGEHEPLLIGEFFQVMGGGKVPVVLGVRPTKQRVAEFVMGAYCRAVYGVSDILCGMKAYHLSVLQQVGTNAGDRVGTYGALAALRAGHAFAEIPVTGVKRLDSPRFGSRFRANKQIMETLLATIKDKARYEALK